MALKDTLSMIKDAATTTREVGVILLVCGLLFSECFLKMAVNRYGTITAAIVEQAAGEQKVRSIKTTMFGVEKTYDLDDILRQNVKTSVTVAGIEVQLQDAAKNQAAAGLQKAANQTKELAAQVGEAKAQLEQNINSVQKALASGPGAYGIAVSADKDDAGTAEEVDQVRKLGVGEVVVYERQGYKRTVVQFANAQAAASKLSVVKAYRNTAYTVNLSLWCPNAAVSDKTIREAKVMRCPAS